MPKLEILLFTESKPRNKPLIQSAFWLDSALFILFNYW